MSNGRPGSPLRHLSTIGNPEPGDEQHGAWPRERLEKMDRKFVARLERAIKRGDEQPPAARADDPRPLTGPAAAQAKAPRACLTERSTAAGFNADVALVPATHP
jgi:hypothetical protein